MKGRRGCARLNAMLFRPRLERESRADDQKSPFRAAGDREIRLIRIGLAPLGSQISLSVSVAL